MMLTTLRITMMMILKLPAGPISVVSIPGINQVLHLVLLQQLLQVCRFLVPQIKETVARMVSVESKFRTSRISSAFCSEFERAVATDAELVLALRAGEMHTASLGERVPEVASGATDPVLRQVGLNALSLSIRVVLLFPSSKVSAR